MKWMEAAYAELGQLEVSGRDANPEIIGYFKAVAREDILSDEVAWCAAFAGACLLKAGISLSHIPPADRLLANSLLRVGTKIEDLRTGAVCVLTRGSNPAYGHVGFVVGWTKTDVFLLGGNQANAVNVTSYPRARIRGLRWPEAAPATKDMVATSRIAAAQQQIVRDSGKIGVTQPTAPYVPGMAPAAPPPSVDALPAPDVIAAKASGLQTALETGISFAGFVAHRWPWVMAAAGTYWLARIAYNAWRSRAWRKEDAATGKTPAAIERPPIEPDFFDGASDTRSARWPDARGLAEAAA